MGRWTIVVAAVAGSGCSYRAGDFMCTSDESCSATGIAGRCEPNGFCSFVDTTCASGRRFGDGSGPYSNMCVGVADAGVDSAPDVGGGPFCDPSDPHLVACYQFE